MEFLKKVDLLLQYGLNLNKAEWNKTYTKVFIVTCTVRIYTENIHNLNVYLYKPSGRQISQKDLTNVIYCSCMLDLKDIIVFHINCIFGLNYCFLGF